MILEARDRTVECAGRSLHSPSLSYFHAVPYVSEDDHDCQRVMGCSHASGNSVYQKMYSFHINNFFFHVVAMCLEKGLNQSLTNRSRDTSAVKKP